MLSVVLLVYIHIDLVGYLSILTSLLFTYCNSFL